MERVNIAEQDGILIRNEEEFFSFYDSVLSVIEDSGIYTPTQKKMYADRIKINKLFLMPNSYPVILLPHPDAEDGKKLPWYFIHSDRIVEIFKVLNQAEQSMPAQTCNRFSKDR